MRCSFVVLFVGAVALAAPVVAHPGHGATVAHLHVDKVPVDLAAWCFVALLGVAAVLQLRTPTRR